ncbi:MAG: CPBP family intramembrane metalloprotease [Ruminococcus sp.]|nr:CPBP family intramembrane metalloprotease [Ruminococcus sp.]
MINYNALQQNAPPDDSEKKALRRYYFNAAWIIIALVLVFSAVNTGVMLLSASVLGGGFSKEQLDAGKEAIQGIPVMKAVYSYGFPIAGDIAAIGVGILVTKRSIKEKFKLPCIGGKEFFKFTALSFGVVTVGSFVNMILLALIELLSGNLSNFSIEETAQAASVAPQGNPLWLDVLIYIYICVLGPVLEELVFRGVLLDALRKYGNAFGIIVSSVMFGLMHQNFMQCIPAVCMGLVWAVMAVKTGSVIPSAAVHILNNTMSAVIMVMLESVSVSSLTDINAVMNDMIPLIVCTGLNVIIRLACIIASVVIMIGFCSKGKKLVVSNAYTNSRTWKYILTSVPWLIVTAYMLYGTVASIGLIS